VTFTNDLARDKVTLQAFKDFREEAERKKFRYFLEVFDPNVNSGIPPEKLGEFINDNIVRTLAGVTEAGRPVFLKIVYHGPRLMEELAQYDPNLVVGVLGGSAGTTYDAFRLIHDAQKYGARVALWIDTEGHACEVLEGLGGIAQHITMLHVELESEPCISSSQRLYPEARALLESMRFEELATDHAHSHPQFNALFIRRGLDARARQRVAARLSWAGLRQGLIDSLGQLCPGCHRRLAAIRSRVMRWRDQRRSAKQPARESLT
jgi:hypothetical protein